MTKTLILSEKILGMLDSNSQRVTAKRHFRSSWQMLIERLSPSNQGGLLGLCILTFASSVSFVF